MNTYDLNGKVAVITGGAQGIGFAVAQRMRDSGAILAIWDRDQGWPEVERECPAIRRDGAKGGGL